ncbi:protein kinase [bacterium]|nr:protein kinase [bacterium]
MPEQPSHPTPDQLNAYGLGQLPSDEATVIEKHISECEPCCETIADLAGNDTFLGLLQNAERTVDQQSGPTSQNSDGVPGPLAEHSRYEILGLVGKGGMGDVYKARHRKMQRTVALKVIKRELVRQSEAVDRFHREVRAAAQLSHPNIVTSHDADQAGDFHFMVMEYVDGVDLAQVVRDRGALPIREACDYIRQAALGLQHAHQQGMVHRDIKPHNLMVMADGTVKVLDFGLASLAPRTLPDADAAEADSDLTIAGAIMGTPDFISPEQANDARQADIRSDIYSLGATFYFLLSGRPLFAEGSVMQKLKSHAQAEPEPLQSLREDVPPELVAVVRKMIAKNPEERYQTPEEVANVLEAFLQASSGQEQSSGGNLSGGGGQNIGTSEGGPDWLGIVAQGLFILAWIPVLLMLLAMFSTDEATVEDGYRTWYYVIAAFFLSSISGVAYGIHKVRLNNRQLSRGGRSLLHWVTVGIVLFIVLADIIVFVLPAIGLMEILILLLVLPVVLLVGLVAAWAIWNKVIRPVFISSDQNDTTSNA